MNNPAILVERARIIRKLREFFDAQGFIEVETAVRIAAPAPEEHIDCPLVPLPGGETMFLRASPELQMKKLLAMGMEKIYQIGPCFREGEKGARHNPEFTMIEWYRRDANYLDIADDLGQICGVLGLGEDATNGSAGTPCMPSRLTVREAYRQFAGWDPWETWNQDRFDFDMATIIEPSLKEIGGGILLMDYPRQAASLAKVRGDVAERWEFYYDGMELANCFTELCDRAEQTARFERARTARRKLGEADYPVDTEFLAMLEQIGSAAGVALGVDRLVMCLTGVKDITAVRA